jgi:hypothetical protein
MKDQLFTRILEEISTYGSKVRWAASSGAATPPPALPPLHKKDLHTRRRPQ